MLDELKALPQWVTWKLEDRGGKPTKVPYRADGAGLASVTDASTWSTVDEAKSRTKLSGQSGVGFVVTAADCFAAIDIDKCRDPETGEFAGWAQAIVDRLDSYTEITPSSEGVRVWVKAQLGPGRNRGKVATGGVEMYDHDRYFTVTGQHLALTPTTIEDRQAELDELRAELFPPAPPAPPQTPSGSTVAQSPALTDGEVLDLARAAKNGDKVRQLLAGNTGGYASASEADQALLSCFAFYTQDTDQLDRLYRGSGLYREKWEREDYRRRTIEKALSGISEVYQLAGGGEIRSSHELLRPLPRAAACPAFPVDVLPQDARLYVECLAAGGIPLEFVGPAALVALSAAVGGRTTLVVKDGSWTEPTVLWLLMVGRRGSKKSPALSCIRQPFDRISTSWSREYRSRIDAWEGLNKSDQKIISRPVHRRLTADDTTTEALARTLEANPDGLLLAADETAALINGLGQYKKTSAGDRARFLSLWNAAPLTIDRVSAGHIHVPRPIVNIVSGIQPEMLGALEGPDGLRERFLVSRYEGPPVALKDLESVQSEADRWDALVLDLVAHRSQQRELRFDKAAADRFVELQGSYAEEQGAQDTPDQVDGWLSKAASQLARISLTLASARYVEAETVTVLDLNDAARVVDYFLAQVRTLPVTGANLMLAHYQRDEDKAVEALAAFAHRSHEKRVMRREIQRAHVAGARTPAEIDRLVKRYGETHPGHVVETEVSGNKTLAIYAPGHRPEERST